MVTDRLGNTFRSVYTVRFTDRVFVLHAFQKKAQSGIATPKSAIELRKRRLKQGVEISRKSSRPMARKIATLIAERGLSRDVSIFTWREAEGSGEREESPAPRT